ncbi:MAG: hypothetical protein LBD37_05405 [Treponema sp.]|nr:hypothetical protein [Treponema sp.]
MPGPRPWLFGNLNPRHQSRIVKAPLFRRELLGNLPGNPKLLSTKAGIAASWRFSRAASASLKTGFSGASLISADTRAAYASSAVLKGRLHQRVTSGTVFKIL